VAGRKMRMNQAVTAALADSMREDPDVVLFGEDVALAGGPFKTSDGLLEEFGPSRVRDTSISEMGFVGIGVGAAATGLRPVVDMMFVEFLGVALDQLSTEAAKYRYLSRGELSVPITVRASIGGGLGFGAQHSQTLETWFTATPGLKLAVASGARTAYGLVRAAIRDDNPVIVLEPRALYGTREEVVTGEEGVIPLGVAEQLRAGTDVTIVTAGRMVGVALAAAEAADVSAEVLDLRTIVPWDRDTVLRSVRRTGRLAVVEENPFSGGWGTEIASFVASHAWGELQAPVLRITAPDVPVPFAKPLEDRYAPWPAYVIEQIVHLCKTGELPEAWWQQEGWLS
jgi:acetoin:2,6-dichlorophenolindophenol oxidoreductase subunit beta